MNHYFEKWGLTTNGILEEKIPDRKSLSHIGFSGLFSFIGIFIVTVIEYHTDFTLVVASFGASAVLIYDAIESPLAQPRNVIGGHFISSLIGVSLRKLFTLNESIAFYLPLVAALAVSLSIVVMGLTKTVHPPGGASALIAVIGPPGIINQGYMYVLHPITTGITIMVVIAIILNNILTDRHYPKYYF